MTERTNTKKLSLCLDLARLKFLRIWSLYSVFKRSQPAGVFEPVNSQSWLLQLRITTCPHHLLLKYLFFWFDPSRSSPLPWETLCCHGPRSRVSWWWCRWAPSRLHRNRLRGTAWWARSSATATSLHAWWTRHRSSRTPFKYNRPGTHADRQHLRKHDKQAPRRDALTRSLQIILYFWCRLLPRSVWRKS